ncbi:MAG: dihydrofolate reductase family protein [Anaerolineae bacterium]|mgnify:CR=1 FL=1|jgi:dihydrofolate reductase|nr:dihydrofolate reductase family protein [Anaerolineae bacterium]MDX9830307.1 dihydrofolate reductase family protein [Anaerolineae bacterium]
MRKIIYSLMVSLDGYIAGPDGDLDWATVDRELHEYVNDQERNVDTHLYGRRTWEVMSEFWPTAGEDPTLPDFEAEYARIWIGMDKLVFSRTLDHVEGNARLVPEFRPDEIRRLKEQPGKDMAVAGAELAATFMRHGLVDQIELYVHPVLLGGGKPMFRSLAQPRHLRLVSAHTFGSGVVHLCYENAQDRE